MGFYEELEEGAERNRIESERVFNEKLNAMAENPKHKALFESLEVAYQNKAQEESEALAREVDRSIEKATAEIENEAFRKAHPGHNDKATYDGLKDMLRGMGL